MALFGDVLSLGRRKSADSARRRASSIQRKIGLMRTIQNRRAFIRSARGAMAQNLVQGISTGADLSSSGFQGTQASLQTQRDFGLFEQREEQRLTGNIETELDRATRNDRQAANNQLGGDFVQSIVQSQGGI